MSRAYQAEVYAKGIPLAQLQEVMVKRFGWEEMSLSDYDGVLCFTGEGRLYGGQSEEEAHDEIYKALKAINPNALISTKWTYLEDLPHSQYGDDFDVDTPLPDTFSEQVEGGATL